MAITKIILQQMVTMDQNSITASKYPKYTVVLGNTISSITAGELTSAIESSKSSAAAAKQSEINAKQSELNAKDSENEAEISSTSSQQSATQSASSATASANSAKAAKTSETNAKASETAAKTSETNAKASETAAKTSETNANNSKTAAAASASAAKISETNAKQSELNAKNSENEAEISAASSQQSAAQSASSATAAASSAEAANTSETNAKASELAAKTSETNAKASETTAAAAASAALVSETNAAASASAAKTSETNAANSASAASDSKGFRDEAEIFATQAAADAVSAKNSETAAKTSETNAKASETATKQAQAEAAESANTASAAVVTINQIKADTQKIKDDAVAETTELKNTAVTAASTATDKATQAEQSAATSTSKADIATQKASDAEAAAARAEQAASGTLKKDQNLADVANINTARTNLKVDKVVQGASYSDFLSANGAMRLRVQDNNTWGGWNGDWIALGIGNGGTGARDIAGAKINLGVQGVFCTTSTDAGKFNQITSPDGKLSMFVANNGNWGVQSTTGEAKPLAIERGGTGATTAAEARRSIGRQWEETQKFLSSEAIVMLRPSASVNQWIAFYREDGTAAIRLGHETDGSLSAHSYNTDGSYRKKILQIDEDATVNIFASLYSNASINGTFAVLKQNTYPRVELIATSRSGSTDVGAKVSFEIPSLAGNSPYFVQRNIYDNTNQLVNSLPSTGGVIAVQGTSGREYKKDISTADSNEALSRVTSLEMVNFVYKDDEKQRVRFGIIAEDAEKIAPQYIKHNQFPIPGTEVFDDEGNKIGEEYQDRPSVDINPIVMDLLGCIQAQQKQIDELKELVKQLLAK